MGRGGSWRRCRCRGVRPRSATTGLASNPGPKLWPRVNRWILTGTGFNANGLGDSRTAAAPCPTIHNPTINYSYGYDSIGQLTSVQALDPDSTVRLNENLSYTYDASGNLASRPTRWRRLHL